MPCRLLSSRFTYNVHKTTSTPRTASRRRSRIKLWTIASALALRLPEHSAVPTEPTAVHKATFQ